MRRYIVLLLITGILWAQTDFDTLILKSGTTYFGEYSIIEGEIVFFKPQNVFAFQPVPVELIQTLKLKDGHFIIEDGKNALTLEEYQKFSAKEKVLLPTFDTLILKSGTTYFGEYSIIEGEIVFFKPQNVFAFQPVPVELIQTLKLKDGHFIIEDGKNALTLEEYQKFSAKEKVLLPTFDTLILKSGTTYFGEYSKIEEEIVYFKPQNAFAFQPISIKQIQTLKLKDGHFIIGEQLPVAIEDGFSVWLKSKGVIETSQKLSTKEKAIYDAKSKNLVKWALYGPTSIIIFMGSTFLHQGLMGGEFWESPIFLGGSLAASLTISYFVLNRKEKFNFPKSILTDSEKEIYKQTYSKIIRERKDRLILGSVAVTGILCYLMFMNMMSKLDFSSSSSGSSSWFTPW